MRLDPQDAAPEAVRMLNPKMARRHVCVPIRADDDTITLAMANPLDLVAIEDLVRVSERRVNVVVAPESEILAAIPQ
jgi:type IV pilus assembly protein PilB